MKGNEFIDKMEHIDPKYIEAADMQPAKAGRGWIKWAAVAAAAAVVAVAVIIGSNSPKQPEQIAEAEPTQAVQTEVADEPVATPFVPFIALEPTNEPIPKKEDTVTIDYSCYEYVEMSDYIIHCKVDKLTEYALNSKYNDKDKMYRSKLDCTVLETLYGDVKAGDTITTIFTSTSYDPKGYVAAVEEGIEYILLLKTREPVDEYYAFAIDDLSPNYIAGSTAATMPINSYGNVVYDTVYGDLDGKANSAKLQLVEGTHSAYTAKYEDIRAKLLEIITAVKGVEEPEVPIEEPTDE